MRPGVWVYIRMWDINHYNGSLETLTLVPYDPEIETLNPENRILNPESRGVKP